MTTYSEIKDPWGRFAINSQMCAERPVVGPTGAERAGKGCFLSRGCSLGAEMHGRGPGAEAALNSASVISDF